MRAGHSRLAGLAAAALAAATGLVGLSATPADAAQCDGTTGVSVVVDFNHGAGGGLQSACDLSGGGKYASEIFPDAGFALKYVEQSPGFVCRVNSLPTSANCGTTAPADAYWGLFWAGRGSSSWTYASVGVGGLKIPEGGAVAFAFQDGGATDYPGVAPSRRSTPAPTPTPHPTQAPTRAPSSRPAGSAPVVSAPKASRLATAASRAPSSSAAARASTTASAPTSASASPTGSTEPTASGTATPETASARTPDGRFTPADQHSGLPVWVPLAVIVALAGAAGGAVWWRTRTGAA